MYGAFWICLTCWTESTFGNQVQNDSLLNRGECSGSFVVMRLSEESSSLVLTAKAGEPNQSTLSWLIFILLSSNCINQPFSQQELVVLDSCRSKWTIDMRNFGVCFSNISQQEQFILSYCSTSIQTPFWWPWGDLSPRVESQQSCYVTKVPILGEHHIKFHLLHLLVIILASKMISHCWECEIQSVNAALTTVLVLQVLSKEVLTTVLVELEGVFN